MSRVDGIHLVMGMSSVGKSRYIESRFQEGTWRGVPLFMAGKVETPVSPSIVHYNLYRPFKNRARFMGNALLDDPALVRLLQHPDQVTADVLVAPYRVVAKRCLLRQGVEPDLGSSPGVYPNQEIFNLMCRLDLEEFHRRWFALLKEYRVAFEIIDATTDAYADVSSEAAAIELLKAEVRVRYSPGEVDHILGTNHFEYQQMELPGAASDDAGAPQASEPGKGLARLLGVRKRRKSPADEKPASRRTKGQDRSGTLKFLGEDLAGKSVLDIGCAYGFFCFEAEKRNAARVVGTELKQHRFVGSHIMKLLYESKSVFLFQDIFSEPLNETFEIVLFLNVIHHLHEPVKALRVLAAICTEQLVIEFPTLADKKFRATLPNEEEIDSSLPLIGVSSLPQEGQTFLFSKAAIRRILMDHDNLFSHIDFHDSPIGPERCVAVCHK